MTERVSRGTLQAAEMALVRAATDFGQDDIIAGPSPKLAMAVLDAVLPAIEQHVRRSMAREVLALDAADHKLTRNVGPWGDMKTSLKRLARGEELPDVKGLRGGNSR